MGRVKILSLLRGLSVSAPQASQLAGISSLRSCERVAVSYILSQLEQDGRDYRRRFEGAELTYRLFYTDGANSTDGMPNGDRFSHLEFQSLGATINAACDLIKRGCGVWRIESRSGLVMHKAIDVCTQNQV